MEPLEVDVTGPEELGQWQPLPWSALEERYDPDWRVFARSAADSKGPMTQFMLAVELLDELELKHPTLLSFYKSDDKYSREKLSGDLEKLEAYYKDRGYVEFAITSTQVSITPKRDQVYISLNIEEGEKFTINEVNLIGELSDVRKEDLERLLVVSPGQTFSQARVTANSV